MVENKQIKWGLARKTALIGNEMENKKYLKNIVYLFLTIIVFGFPSILLLLEGEIGVGISLMIIMDIFLIIGIDWKTSQNRRRTK